MGLACVEQVIGATTGLQKAVRDVELRYAWCWRWKALNAGRGDRPALPATVGRLKTTAPASSFGTPRAGRSRTSISTTSRAGVR